MWSLADKGKEGKKASSRTLSQPTPHHNLTSPTPPPPPHGEAVITLKGLAGEFGRVPTAALGITPVLSGIGPQPGEAPVVIPVSLTA